MKIVFKVCLLLTLFSLPLYVIRFKIASIPFTFLEVMIGITIFLWLLIKEFKLKNLVEIIKTEKNIWFLILLFLLASIISVVISVNKTAALGIFKAYIIEPILIFIIIRDLLQSKESQSYQRILLYGLNLSGFLVSFVAIGQKISGINWYAPQEAAQDRVTGFFNSANSLCLFLIPIATLALSIVLDQFLNHQIDATVQERKRTIALLVLMFIYWAVIFFTKSQGGKIGLIVSIMTVFILSLLLNRRISKDKSMVYESIIKMLPRLSVLLMCFYFLAQIVFFSTILGRLTPKVSEKPLVRQFQDTTTVRLCLWEGTWKIIEHKGFVGIGFSSFPEVYHQYLTCDPELLQYPHNVLLTFWTETGLFGVVSMFILLTYIVYQLFLLLKKTATAAGYLPAVIAIISIFVYYLIHGLVDVPYFKNDLSLMWWIFLGWGISLISIKKQAVE